ncbi:zinc-binding dehydrogenase [Phenylobacterium sp.]|uniref:zinc-binding dehydrogenase n=1 Tax=Phenylobacterium sp. TaxID=1871053 RepID=UPI0035B13C6D
MRRLSRSQQQGGQARFTLVETTLPVLRPFEVQVRVELAPVTEDAFVASRDVDDAWSPGRIAVGRVQDAGEQVADVRVGDRVLIVRPLLYGGCYGDALVATAEQVLRLPDDVSASEALDAADVMAAELFLEEGLAGLRPSALLILQPKGSLPLALAHRAAARGFRVIATADTREEAQRLQARGAAVAENRASETIRTLTDGRGADVVLDPVAGPGFAETLRGMADFGHLFFLGARCGEPPQLFDTLWENLDACPCIRAWDFGPPATGCAPERLAEALRIVRSDWQAPDETAFPLEAFEAARLAAATQLSRVVVQP